MKETKKPPLGLMPKYLWDELCSNNPYKTSIADRKIALKNAIKRYNKSKIDIPNEWLTELNSLNS